MKPQARPDPVNLLPFTKAALRKIQQRIDEKWTIGRMAEIAHIRVRALHRHIQDAAGLAPSEWLTQQPIACARDLLEETNFSIDEITPSYGFGATTNFRQYCRTTTGLPPASNRCHFRITIQRPRASYRRNLTRTSS
ncbi:helix-turn-helix domain-containing protein [Acetobacter senegalensis]|nr:helix-turn-helix domain-containing protein [Acetobacter senegalensis]